MSRNGSEWKSQEERGVVLYNGSGNGEFFRSLLYRGGGQREDCSLPFYEQAVRGLAKYRSLY